MAYKRNKIDNKPQIIDAYNWFYDGEKDFIFVHEVRDKKTKKLIQTDQFKVPIEQLADFIAEMK